MDFVRLYRAVDTVEKKQIEEHDSLSFDKFVIKPQDDFNTFNYKTKRKHFYFDLACAYLYSKIKGIWYLYSFDMPLSLCLNNIGAGHYIFADDHYFFLECGIPIKELAKYTKDYKALIPMLNIYRYYDSEANLYVKKLINMNNMIDFNEYKDVTGSVLNDFQSNEFAKSIYEQSVDFKYRYDVPADQVYEYLEDKKLILHK